MWRGEIQTPTGTRKQQADAAVVWRAAPLGGRTGCGAAWLARCVRDAEVPGSNPGSPTRNPPLARGAGSVGEPATLGVVTAEGVGLERPLSDEELTALALAADPDAPIPEDAVPVGVHLALRGPSLPLWYMAPAVSRGGHRWKAPFVIAVVAAFLLIDTMGLCNTYGILGL